MNLIDYTYFVNDILLTNLNKDDQLSSLNSSIAKYQKEVLIRVLGYKLYSLFIVNPEAEQRFIDLRDGKEFSFIFDGVEVTREYIGLKNESKESLIAYYVYFYHQRKLVTRTSDIGENIPLSENSMNASSYDKIVKSWNDFIELAGRPFTNNCFPFNKLHKATYDFADDSGSLYNFLLANKDVYPEWEFTYTENINHMGI